MGWGGGVLSYEVKLLHHRDDIENHMVEDHSFACLRNIYRLLYENGEILTRVSIAMTRACECHANANECQYFSIFVQ